MSLPSAPGEERWLFRLESEMLEKSLAYEIHRFLICPPLCPENCISMQDTPYFKIFIDVPGMANRPRAATFPEASYQQDLYMVKLAHCFSPNTLGGHRLKERLSMLVMILRWVWWGLTTSFKSGLKLLPHQSVSGTTACCGILLQINTWNEGRFHRPETIQ